MICVDTLILGGGLTGLSVAYHLQQKGHTRYLVLEQNKQPGGLCRSIHKEGFTFDASGHVLHLHTAYGKQLVKKLLKNNLLRHRRQAWVYTQDARVPFPFQANLYALPEKKRQACVAGLLKAARETLPQHPKNFETWCLQAFGPGIYGQFLRPYNTKLWGVPPRQMTCQWCSTFVPRPTRAEIKKSLTRPLRKTFGYNATFYYPRSGGCGALAEALAGRVLNVRTGLCVTQIDLRQKTVRAGGKIFHFRQLVNTLPLPQFLKLLHREPALSHLAEGLQPVPVLVYHLALRATKKPFSWIYFPDPQEPFYRVGMQSSFSPQNAPEGCCSLYIELPGTLRAGKTLEKRIWNSLLQKGIITKGDKKLFSFWQPLPYAYALYNPLRTRLVQAALKQLEKRGCLCAGRYGRWEYSFMEQSLLQGKELARQLNPEVL